jgi:hypothetical protein
LLPLQALFTWKHEATSAEERAKLAMTTGFWNAEERVSKYIAGVLMEGKLVERWWSGGSALRKRFGKATRRDSARASSRKHERGSRT